MDNVTYNNVLNYLKEVACRDIDENLCSDDGPYIRRLYSMELQKLVMDAATFERLVQMWKELDDSRQDAYVLAGLLDRNPKLIVRLEE